MINALKGLFLYEMETCGGPAVDLYETGDALVFEIDLPGADLSRLSVRVFENVLIVEGQPRHEREETEADAITYLCMERGPKGFRRVVKLPVLVNTLAAAAWYRDGVLTVTFPKLKGKMIEIAVERRGN